MLVGTASGQDDDLEWPREIDDPRARILIYQPQVDSFVQNDLTARAALSVTTPGSDQPVFGTAWMESRVSTDRDDRTVTILETKVPRVRFPDATEEQQATLAKILIENISDQIITFSLDRLLTMLDLADHERQAADDFDTTPPKIQFVNYPAILVTIDGEPQLRDIEGNEIIKRVVNSAFMIVIAGSDNYLYAGQGQWYSSLRIMGPWELTETVPTAVQKLAPVEDEKAARERAAAAMEETGEEPDLGSTTPPTIIMATVPTELIVTDGEPEYKPVGTDLLYVDNSESDVLVEIATQRHFVLLSGRWFAAPGVDGPWSFVASDALPESFKDLHAEGRLQRVGQAPGEHPPRIPIDDRHQVYEASRHRDVCDVGGPHLIDPRNRQIPQ